MSAAPAHGASEARVGPWLPLTLLESIRAHDRPREVLEDEDLAASLPRRLGLTGVIETQIQRYRTSVRRGRGVPVDEVVDLLRLILRRPDADPILREAGAQLARRQFERLASPTAALLGVLPRAARARILRRASRRLLREISGPARIDMKEWPLRLRITGSPLTGAEGSRTACALYGSVLETLVELYTDRRVEAVHTRCAGLGHEQCEWTLEEEPAAA